MLTIVLLGLACFGAFSFFGRSNDSEYEVSVDEAHEKVENGVLLLDVRRQAEWDECHVPGAVLIPLDQLPSRLNEVPKDNEVVVMCRSGNRSLTAAKMMRTKGYDQAVSMKGGINDWYSKDYDLTCTE